MPINDDSPLAAPKPKLSAEKFKSDLTALMVEQSERPFVCDGLPMTASTFIVGFNPAASLPKNFWDYWTDAEGFNRRQFEDDYAKVKVKRGNRLRIEAISSAFPNGSCLETNIYSSPSKSAAVLSPHQKRTAVFEYLLETIQPTALYIHSVAAVNFFGALNRNIADFADDVAMPVELFGRKVTVMLRRKKALYTMAVDDARKCGEALAGSASMLDACSR